MLYGNDITAHKFPQSYAVGALWDSSEMILFSCESRKARCRAAPGSVAFKCFCPQCYFSIIEMLLCSFFVLPPILDYFCIFCFNSKSLVILLGFFWAFLLVFFFAFFYIYIYKYV